MALIKCTECNAEISSESDACVNCGHPTKKTLANQKRIEKEAAAKTNQPGPVSYIASTAIVLGILYACTSGDDKPTERKFGLSDALYMCQSIMKAASKYPDKAEVPYLTGYEEASGFAFSWGASTEHMMFMNGLGQMMPTSGSCYVNRAEKKVTQLTINGKTVI